MSEPRPRPSDTALAVLLVGLALRGGADLLEPPARARLDAILREAGVPRGRQARSARPQLLAYLESLELDAEAIRALEGTLLTEIEQDRRRARRACGRLLGAPASTFENRRSEAPKGTLRLSDMAPARRLR